MKFTLTDLSNRSGEVVDAAHRGPVELTKHGRPRFMLMTIEDYRALKRSPDARRSHLSGETPPDIAAAVLPRAGGAGAGRRV